MVVPGGEVLVVDPHKVHLGNVLHEVGRAAARVHAAWSVGPCLNFETKESLHRVFKKIFNLHVGNV